MELKRIFILHCCPFYTLLIVPYGIETISLIVRVWFSGPFNRTLWN